jgi:hypothetical protein
MARDRLAAAAIHTVLPVGSEYFGSTGAPQRAATGADAHFAGDGLVSRVLHAARKGPETLEYPWGQVRVQIVPPPDFSRAAVSLRIVPTVLWDSIAARAQADERVAMDWCSWLRPTAWALARQLLPRDVYLANLAFPSWRATENELFAVIVPDGTEAADRLVELERDFFNGGMARLLRALDLEVDSIRSAMRASTRR